MTSTDIPTHVCNMGRTGKCMRTALYIELWICFIKAQANISIVFICITFIYKIYIWCLNFYLFNNLPLCHNTVPHFGGTDIVIRSSVLVNSFSRLCCFYFQHKNNFYRFTEVLSCSSLGGRKTYQPPVVFRPKRVLSWPPHPHNLPL